MSLKILAASVATASAIGLTWEDCGDAETTGTVYDLQPTTLNLGQNQLKGTGELFNDEDGGTFNFVAKAGPVPILKGGGNLCEDTTIDMPLGAGSVVFHAIDCPRAAGDIEIDLDINVLSEEVVTNDLIKVSLTAEGTTGDKLLCMDIGIQNEAKAVEVAAASGIDLTWSDCGDADTVGKVTDLQPTSINLGKNQLKGTGTLSKDEDGGNFNFVAKAGPIPVLKGSGNLCEDTTINMPLGAGSVVFHAIDCPRAAGDIEIDLDINVLSEEVTNDLLKISLTAEGTTGDKLLCMDIGVQTSAKTSSAITV